MRMRPGSICFAIYALTKLYIYAIISFDSHKSVFGSYSHFIMSQAILNYTSIQVSELR